MSTPLRRSVSLSLLANDVPIWSEVATVGTLYQQDQTRFHLLVTEPDCEPWSGSSKLEEAKSAIDTLTPRLLWLEISPYRVILTMQGNGRFSYRHWFEMGVFGVSRYWLTEEANNRQFRMRNFTRGLHFKGNPVPHCLLLEYELWADSLRLGYYSLSLEIQD